MIVVNMDNVKDPFTAGLLQKLVNNKIVWLMDNAIRRANEVAGVASKYNYNFTAVLKSYFPAYYMADDTFYDFMYLRNECRMPEVNELTEIQKYILYRLFEEVIRRANGNERRLVEEIGNRELLISESEDEEEVTEAALDSIEDIRKFRELCLGNPKDYDFLLLDALDIDLF